MSKAPQRRWFQFTTRGVFMATFWMAVFFGDLLLFNRLWNHELVAHESEEFAYLIIGCLLFVSIPAAIGGLFGRWGAGALIGLGLFCAYVAYVLIVIYIVGI